MKTVLQMLRLGETERAPLTCLLETWGVRQTKGSTPDSLIHNVAEAMITPDRVDAVWALLSDRERGALQTLLGAKGGSHMPWEMFRALHGEIRDMGEGAVQREKPHIQPKTVSEGLYYRGLIGRSFDNSAAGTRRVVYVPSDLVSLLINMGTSYDNLPDDAGTFPPDAEASGALAVEALPDPPQFRAADTSLIDDLTTLLAYIQLQLPALEDRALTAPDAEALLPFLLHDDPARFRFLVRVGIAAGLIEVQESKAVPKRAEVRRWLGLSRAEQVKSLAEAWRGSRDLIDLWHVPGLEVNRAAGTMPSYDAAAARAVFISLLVEYIPREAWWSLDDFIHIVYANHSDFQRADFNSWYIQSATGGKLRGIENWESVEGALLDYWITGPLYWLGLVDLSDETTRLSAYGRGFLNLTAFPTPPDPQDKISIQPDGTLLISRRVSRTDRFTAARFTTWVSGASLSANTPYAYRLDAPGLRRAGEQGITAGQIAAFLSRTAGDDKPLPPSVAKLLEKLQLAPVSGATLQRALVLRTTAKETLDLIYETPELRRFFGARLGDLAAILRADPINEALDILNAHGIKVEVSGL
jgi:hypothetical protein